MTEIVFLLEERSTREMLLGILPRLGVSLPPVRYVVFDGKQDLDKNLARRVRGYMNPGARFIVIRDQDSAPDCKALKQRLLDACIATGRRDVVVRIFCRELETAYLADLAAVEAALDIRGLARRQEERRFRAPDRLNSPSAELTGLTAGRYQKIGGSRAIAHHLNPDNGRSPSFRTLIAAIRRAAPGPSDP